MGKALFLMIGVFGFIILSTTMGSQDNLRDAARRSADGQLEVLARNTAVAAEELAVQRLSESFVSREEYGDYEGTPYHFRATTSSNHVVIEVTATSRSSRSDSLKYHIRSEYDRVLSSNIATEVPPFMQYAFITGEDLVLKGTISGDVYATGYEANMLNADVHTNASLFLDGIGSANDPIRGHGTYALTAQAGQESFWKKKFKPNYFSEESNGDPVYKTAPVEIPPLDIAYSASDQSAVINATVQVPLTAVLMPEDGPGGTYYLSANTLPGTPSRDHPAIYLVRGSLEITSDLDLDSYSLFIVEGVIDFQNKTVRPLPSAYDGPDESSLAFYSAQQIYTSGNAEVWAQIYSKGGITFGGGQPTVYGNIATWGEVTFSGTLDMKYRKASPALTVIWNDDSVTKLRRLAYAEW